METDGEGGGGGEAERRGRSELGRLLEAIENSEVLEKRIPLVKQLEQEFAADDLGLVLQALLASWVDSTCSGVSHCTLHRSILQVALKCSALDIADNLGSFFTLCAKASSWCAKHLQWSAKCIDQSQVVEEEEHNRLREEVNSLSLSISGKLLDIAAKCITVPGLEVAEGEEGQGAVQEECALNKAADAFPTIETMVMEVGPEPVHLAAGVNPDPEASRRCMHCSSDKTSQWRPGPDGPDTLCSACWQKGQLLHSNPRHRRGRPSIKGRRCMHCASEKTPNWRPGPDGPATLCNACGKRFLRGRLIQADRSTILQPNACRRQGHPSNKHRSSNNDVAVLVEVPIENGDDMAMASCSLAPLAQEACRRCMHCTLEKTSRWRRGPDGPGTLCNACGQQFLKGRLLHSNSHRGRGCPSKKRRSSSKEDSVAGNNVAALAEGLSCGVGASLDAFFDHMGLEVPWEEAGAERANEEELEWLSNKDAFPSVETMAVEVEEEASAPDVPRARTKGRRRVTAMETTRRQDNVGAEETMRRCTHCATETTSRWREGPEGPRTLCNACGAVFKRGGLLPEYRPANSPAFSPLLHSNRYSRALEMHRRNETSATGEMHVMLTDTPEIVRRCTHCATEKTL